jgi:dihydropteroate synthase
VLPSPGARTLVMGVLNVTPDSFSDGGDLPSAQAVVARAGEMLAAGADVLDLGGESTRPGAAAVSAAEELARVLPALAALRKSFPNAPISIDTYKAEVAEAAVRAGADIVNDIWGGAHGLTAAQRRAFAKKFAGLDIQTPSQDKPRAQQDCAPTPTKSLDSWTASAKSGVGAQTCCAQKDLQTPPDPLPPSPMLEVVARLRCPVILMHNRLDRDYGDFWRDILSDLQFSLALAKAAGVPQNQIWLDPGFGFAKEPAHNLEVLKHLDRIVALGYPVLLGASRKSTLGRVLDGAPADDRREGTAATLVWGIQQGCAMVRLHDVAAMRRFLRVADAIKAGLSWRPEAAAPAGKFPA